MSKDMPGVLPGSEDLALMRSKSRLVVRENERSETGWEKE
jgi:hypothetical protein